MVAEPKYTDRDVRESNTLKLFAERYAFSYSGDFQPLLDAQNMYMSEGCLTTAVARMVLNCARGDARYASQLNEIKPEKPQLFLVPGHEIKGPPWKQVPKRRPSVVELPFKFNFQYGMSAHKLATNIHVPDPERSSVKFFPATWEGRLYLYWMCGRRASELVALVTWKEEADTPIGLGHSVCDKCMRNSAQRKFDEG